MRRLTLMLVGTMAMGSAGVFALACSSDPAQIEPGDDDDDDDVSSSGNTSGGSGGTSSSSSGTASGGTSSGGSSGSAACFAKLRPAPDNGPFCPFVPKSGSSGTGVACATGESCCVGQAMAGGSGFDPSGCVPRGDDCPTDNAAIFECTENDDCDQGSLPPAGDAGADGGSSSGGGGGQVCCLIPNPADDTSSVIADGTMNNFGCTVVKGEYGSRCKSSCGSKELQGCQQDSDCPSDKTCTLASVGQGDRIYMGTCQ